MTVKELIEKLKEFDENLKVYVDVYNEVVYYGGESWQLVDDKEINDVELWRQVYFNREDEPCVILK